MVRRSRPGADPHIRSLDGATREGQPLSYNRAPAADLAQWIARLYVARIEAPADHRITCGLFSETGSVRIQLSGDWSAQTRDGEQRFGRSALFFGPQTKLMPVSVNGSFTMLAIVFRPSACSVLLGTPLSGLLDRIEPAAAVGLDAEALLGVLTDGASPEDWLRALEDLVRRRVGQKTFGPESVTLRFEELAFANPTLSIVEAARQIGVDRRRLERLVSRDFGMPPKQVLKRARALDMASHLRGVADDDEAGALALRYYDESHLIHEFVELFGISPRPFTALAQPILTLTLEARQARRLEMVERIAPGGRRPWE